MNQFPGILFSGFGPAPSRHAGQSNTVFDDVEQLTVGHPLSTFLPHVGRRRIHPLPHLDLAATVVRMTESAVIRPMCFASASASFELVTGFFLSLALDGSAMVLAVWATIVSKAKGCARALNPLARVFRKMSPAPQTITASASAPARNQIKIRTVVPPFHVGY
jgi:hypothetical protein